MNEPIEPKPIEAAWKEAFMKTDELVAPKVVDLYNRKSTHIIDKLERMFRVNIKSIGLAAVALPVICIPFGLPIVGIGLCILLGILVFTSRQELSRLEACSKSDSSYEYLKAFAAWRKAVMQRYTRIYRIMYPLILLTVAGGFWFSKHGATIEQEMLKVDPTLTFVLGMPAVVLFAMLGLAALISLFAGPLYRLDVNIVYGRQFAKLDEIIADMETLRS